MISTVLGTVSLAQKHYEMGRQWPFSAKQRMKKNRYRERDTSTRERDREQVDAASQALLVVLVRKNQRDTEKENRNRAKENERKTSDKTEREGKSSNGRFSFETTHERRCTSPGLELRAGTSGGSGWEVDGPEVDGVLRKRAKSLEALSLCHSLRANKTGEVGLGG